MALGPKGRCCRSEWSGTRHGRLEIAPKSSVCRGGARLGALLFPSRQHLPLSALVTAASAGGLGRRIGSWRASRRRRCADGVPTPQGFGDDHGCPAVWTEEGRLARGPRSERFLRRYSGNRGDVKQLPYLGEVVPAPGIREEADMADAVEAAGQDMQQEAPHEFVGAERHGLVARAALEPVILPAEGDAVRVQGHQALVGNRHPVGFYFANPGVALAPAWQAREWAARLKPSAWRTVVLRDGKKGEVRAEFASTRVWITHPDSDQAHQWHLLARRDGKQVKFMLSNASPETSLAELARMQAQRHFIERAFEDAKGCCGMADYQVRKWRAWHNHMALVCVALLFLVKERQKHAPFATLLSCADVVDMLVAQLPVKIRGREDAVQTIVERHKRRQRARDSAYRRQAPSTEECH